MPKHSLRLLIEWLVYLGGCGFAIWKGGRPERLVGLILVVEFVLVALVQRYQGMEQPRYFGIAIDAATLACILYLTFKHNERWLVLGSAFQLLSVLALVTRPLDPSVLAWSYVSVSITCGYGLVATMVYGAVQAVRQRRRVAS